MISNPFTGSLKVAAAAAALVVFGAGLSGASDFEAFAAIGGQQSGGHGGTTQPGSGDSHDGHEPGSHDDSTHDGEEGHQDSGSRGQRRGRAPGETSTTPSRGHGNLDSLLREDRGGPPEGRGMGRDGADHGSGDDHSSEEEDSDRPDWAGGGGGPNDRGGQPSDAGSSRGSLYGDMYVILRDANGIPILNAAGFVQPVDADGNLIPLDDEGAPVDPSLAQEVELSRLNMGRSPDHVLERRAEEVVTMLNSATAITTDAAGRLVLTLDGEPKTIDSPLENMAIYVALMTTGTIPGVADLPGTEFDHLVDGAFTNADMVSAAALLAGAADKFTAISLDAVAYINAILDIHNQSAGEVTYSSMDYGAYNYDRSDTYGDVTATVLVRQADGSFVPTEVNIYQEVFDGQDFSASGNFSAFATSVDDARAVINYIHEYEVPADEPSH